MSFITIRKPSMWTPPYYKLTNIFSPPFMTTDDILNYYTTQHEFYIQDEDDVNTNVDMNVDMNIDTNVDSDLSESNKSMQTSSDEMSENDKMSVDTSVSYEIQEKLKEIYNKINSVKNGFTLNYGDIVELPTGQMYFYHTPCIRIN